jgi:peptidoglycan/xylan/chitin deacetylase (PgdA/CDA1 family)
MSRPTLLVLLFLKAVAITLACLGYWGAAAVTFFGPDLWVFYHLFVPAAQGLCPSYTRFSTDRPEVWLTIDDGPDPEDTPRVLDLLDRHGARATFFVVGERAARAPELVREIVRRGHDVGHHTQTHPAGTLWCAGPARLTAELDGAIAALRPLAPPLRWFRAPVGIKHLLLPRALRRRGLQCVDWTIRSGDCLSRNPETVRAKVLRRLRPGAILLMHEGPSVPPALRLTAMTHVLEALTARGYRCVLPEIGQLRPRQK